jgi:23S rRNA (guanosine2251-2'-O)-methyltransferase
MKQPPRNQMIMGVHALTELLRHAPDRILRVYTSAKGVGDRKDSLLKECEKWNVPVEKVSEDTLTDLCGSDSHQSFAAHVKGRNFMDLKTFIAQTESQENALILLCDQIFDPQNFGALLRSAECFGADAVIWSKNRGSDLTPVAAKASSGASEWMTLVQVSNLAESVLQLQDVGFEVIASVLKPGAQNAFHFHFAPKTVLVVGSEGEGIQPLIQKRANHCVYLPMVGKIESLNVAQAATALLTCYRMQRS